MENLKASEWHDLLRQFEDASIYQTYSFGAVSRGARNIEHVVLRNAGELAGCCQVMLRPIPLIGTALADIKCGPLWRRRDRETDPQIYRQLLKFLREHYGTERGFFIRIWPHEVGLHQEAIGTELEAAGFVKDKSFQAFRTLSLELFHEEAQLRKNLLQKWRNCLNKAEKSGLSVTEDTSDESFATFLQLAQEMMRRKNFSPGADYKLYGRVHAELPEDLKLRILKCESAGETIAVAIYTVIGDTGTYLLGATSEKGMGLNGAYLLQWRMVTSLKQRGARLYDLGGIDPDNNPGVYQFKLGVAGKQGLDQKFLGQFNGCFGRRPKMARFAFLCSKRAQALLRRK